ncbi:hypothetical protein [Desulfuromonas sp. AOP6]|uniref:hypothetical protein n=1 Tax=Desulfuromonas sp. AOP6 TaxID=1566351 RepID=UPI00127EC358|nr:hypothetical protein [Desulfuromonas sp. AOP6]BCA79761.1 hypothetical protein AOP6_1548 [Desulfuromonas sp. AOP6]
MATDAQIAIRLPSEILERAQLLADKSGISRHKLLSNLVIEGIETLEELDRLGIFRAALISRSFTETLKRASIPTGPDALGDKTGK